MSIKLQIEESERIAPFKEKIESVTHQVLKHIEARLVIPKVVIEVIDSPERAIPETGVGGFAESAEKLIVSINPEFPQIENVIEEEIKSTLAHELHHCVRIGAIGYGDTLFQALITEGLADHFDIEINNTAPRPWSVALDETNMESMLQKAKQEFDNTEYKHADWFFGSEDIPKWTGYSLGFKLVGNYLKKTGKKASELVNTPAKEFLI